MKKRIPEIITGIAILVLICGFLLRAMVGKSISIIGGADGPTSVFVAGKVGGNSLEGGIIFAGVSLLALGVILLIKRKNG